MTFLTLQNISKNYVTSSNTSLPILHDLNMSVSKTETCAIIGRSGSGKSTLLSLISGLEHPDKGNIVIDNQNIISMSEKELSYFRNKTLGIVFQQFHLMPYLSALENIALPLELQKDKQAKAKARQWLTKLNLEDRASHYPTQLSGGEKQRIAIARALITNPSLLLADEPTGNLDDTTSEEIIQILFNLVKEQQMTLLLVTHNKELAQACDRQLLLQHKCLYETSM